LYYLVISLCGIVCSAELLQKREKLYRDILPGSTQPNEDDLFKIYKGYQHILKGEIVAAKGRNLQATQI
jgi:hypothetical protein